MNKGNAKRNICGESGRSLIEMLGVIAIGAIVAAGAVATYRTVRLRQIRMIAEQDLKTIAENARIIYSGRRNYIGISKSYLVKAGAVKVEKIAGYDFKFSAPEDGKSFSIVFDSMDRGDCAYFATKKFDWATGGVAVNGIIKDAASMCAEIHPNKLEFIIR